MASLSSALDYLFAQSFYSLIALYWFVVIFEIPRYALGFFLVPLVKKEQRYNPNDTYQGKISIIIAGHSEEHSIERCVRALKEQTRIPDEIIVVSDGSTDKMPAKLQELQRLGLIDGAHCTDLRAGKSAGSNMAARWTTGDVIINIDCDCSFDRNAIRNVVRPFLDPDVVGVSGNILVRNPQVSLISAFQAIEYMITISLGKQAADRLDQVTCISGAFGAFRRDAYDNAGGLDAGGGEDLDLTLRLRQTGGRVRFAEDALCYTDVPTTRSVLVKQRFRWERDAVHLRFRKHRQLLNPWSNRFTLKEALHEIEFLFFNVVGAAALPFYVIWLFVFYGDFALTIMLSAQIGLIFMDIVVFLLAAHYTPRIEALRLLPYLVGYSFYTGIYMRFVRLGAYLEEWIFSASYEDTYVPNKVHRVRG